MKYHYVYRITNISLKKYYYGARTSIVEPKLDLGIKYFSSSTDKEFKLDQKINHKNYKYKIIKIFKDRKSAEIYETKLHEKFQVQIHESFYNKAKNTLMGFSVEGRKQTPEHSKKIGDFSRGKTLWERYDKETADRMYENFCKASPSPEARARISKARTGSKSSEDTKLKISAGLIKRYTDKEFYSKFCATMDEVNKRKDKREKAGLKIKEKWKDPEYLEKMKNRAYVSNSAAIKEKWNDPIWKESMLLARRNAYKKREPKYDLYDSEDTLVLACASKNQLCEIWNMLHKVIKKKPLGSTRQSLSYLRKAGKINLKGYYSVKIDEN